MEKRKWKVLVSAPYMQPVPGKYYDLLAKHGVELIVPNVRERLSEDELLPLIGDMDGVISGDDQFTERVFDAAYRLKVISKWGTGIDSIDKKAAIEKGVVVRNTPDAFSIPVADSVMGYLLCFARKLPWMNEKIRAGEWDKIPGVSLSECTLGVIGVGNIGKLVVQLATAFGMRVLGTDIVKISDDFLATTGLTMVSQEVLLKESDFVSLNCDLNPTSHHLMGAEEFNLMKPSAYVINTARGPIVDEMKLIEALQQRAIAGAALDVFEVEPLPLDSLLRNFDSVLLAPHNSNSSPVAWERVHERTVNNLLEELERDLI